MSAVATATAISLETTCEPHACRELALPLFAQLSHGYDECSVLSMPESLADWRDEHRTARKRADRAARMGYHFSTVEPHRHVDSLYAINTSLPRRQGRPMSAGYLERPSASPDPRWACERHYVGRYGVLHGDELFAYLWLYRCGELALVSQILGHGDLLDDGIMYLLFEGMLRQEIPRGGFVVYNRHDSGTDGLRFYKERVGLAATEVEWQL